MQNSMFTPYIGMKKLLKLSTILFLALQLISCRDIILSGYFLKLPEAPESWVSVLGEPYWRVEWIDSGGQKQTMEILPGGDCTLQIEQPVTWTNPVMAWPYWPEHNLIPGHFKPAGALFPFDAKGSYLYLTWKAGVDTVFYWDLVIVNELNLSRNPAYFDWPRFRQLFNTETISEAVRNDPWLVNWRSVAERTVSGNFDSRRLVPEVIELKSFPVPGGIWFSTSPFAEHLFFKDGDTPVFPVRPGINVWICAEGILRVNGNTWMFTKLNR